MTRERAPATTGRRPVRRLVINWAAVEQRRIAAGLTHAQLAEQVGVAAVTGPVRLWQDGGHDAVPLGLLERLCQVLDLHPVELFRAPQRAAQRRALTAPEVAADGQVLEAALATLTAMAAAGQHASAVTRAGLADALGWPLHRLTAAITDLDDTLADRGVRLDLDVVTDGAAVHGVAARPGLLTPTQREALHRLTSAEEALDVDTARVLYAAADPELRCSERHRTINADAAVRLQQLGLVRRRDRAHDLELTDDARYALLLDARHVPARTDIHMAPSTDTPWRRH